MAEQISSIDQAVHSAGAHAASMTPPASADGEKVSPNAMSSDLSDLELDPSTAPGMDDIKPDHYYGGGKIPVFKPTMDQFRDFLAFIHKIDEYGMRSGVVKVIPPKEWIDALPPLDEAIKTIRVKNPIMQEFHGSHGTYTQANIEKQRSYNLPQWKALCDESSHQPPARRGERRRNLEKARNTAAAKSRSDSQRRKPGPKAKGELEKSVEPVDTRADKSKPESPPTPVSPESKPVETKSEELSEGESLPAPKPKGRQPKSVSSRRKHNRGDQADYIDEEAFKDFDYHIHSAEEYTAERCEELETAYWKSLMYNNPMYGADMPGSLFDDSVTSWNVARLPSLLDVLGSKVPGVNTAYLYLGMWKATFAWHLEDVDLYSINYIHFGAPKQWYSISQEDMPKFEAAMKSIWPTDAKNCDQFLRHKTYLISPSLLKSQYGITVNKMVHYEGEFVITYPYGYHSGYNLGYNCAESVNFATETWLDYARVAKKCNCESDSVWIDIGEIERKLRGESTPEYYDELMSDGEHLEGASDLLTPPRSVPEKSSTRVRKRKREGTEPKTKRIKLHVDRPRKIPCVLCPNNLDYEPLLPTEDGKSHAHRRCAMYIEETTILKDESGAEVVCDIDKIPKARMGLKCLFCREVRGACFQCMYGKCTRAYHPTCALLAGVQVEFGQIAVIANDGQEYCVPSVDLKCKYHRPKRYALPNVSADADSKLTETARNLRAGDLVQFQADKEINGAVILENRPAERALLLKVLPRGDVIELPYRWLLIVKKSNFLPLSPGIKPLPANLARKPDTRKDLTSSLPTPGAPFGNVQSAYQWAEFTCAKPPFNLSSTQVDLEKPEHVWYYLGATSTECRAQYTQDPRQPFHNPKSHFLDSVKSHSIPIPKVHQPHPAAALNNLGPFPRQHSISSSGSHATHKAHITPLPPAPTSQPTNSEPNNKLSVWPPGDVATQFTMARRLVASITDHANIRAGYTIVNTDFVVQSLLGEAGSELPKNGMDKLKTMMAESTVQLKAPDGTLIMQPLDMNAPEVDHLLRMLRFAIVNLTSKVVDLPEKKPTVTIAQEPAKELLPSSTAGKYAYLDIQRGQSTKVYQSPYAPGSGFSEYALREYGLIGGTESSVKPSLARDYFEQLSPEDKEKVLQACGDVVISSRKLPIFGPVEASFVDHHHVPQFETQATTSTMMDAMTVDDHHLSVFDMTLHADSPASSFGRPPLRFHSPHDFSLPLDHDSLIPPRHLNDHHDLFGDQQGNQRFWQRSIPWNEGDTPSHEEQRPFFGPHERPATHDYAASDMDLGRGPSSLHSMDMAGFGFDDLYNDLSP
ncbi:hypothetical protein AJ80_06827 [Polytolypa hystricis UAMH7299]|uniref:[histone H3]-trimethyl-L-lysine(9) demethylase n=1 Tax=Polytolypa hystricis (strain UAMH7299) TaxID=1447883 RepID=A0A2B7XUP6_POLH7|nr:hypothetical protein AJ80_06827 [Polytolypa hystricis UAMH7299]